MLLSDATAALVGDELPAGTALRPLGEHRLKDFPQPAALYQLDIAGLPTHFPPPRTLPRRPGLPVPAGELLGRDADLAALSALLTAARTRLVTVIGPGGIGKTRLAVETARSVADAFPGGVVFVPLGAVADAAAAARHGRRRPRRPPRAGRGAARRRARPRSATTGRCSCWTTSSRWWPPATDVAGAPGGRARRPW